MTKAVLFVDDDGEALISVIKALKAAGLRYECEAVSSAERALECITAREFAAAVIDLSLTKQGGVESGFQLLSDILARAPHCRVTVLTGHASTAHGIKALERGAAHFVEKPADPRHLLALITDSVSQHELRQAHDELRRTKSSQLETIIGGTSASASSLREAIRYAASMNQAVMITGETGTGKSLCARAIHESSARSNYRFVRYQPSFGNADLVNSELFGHRKGAFTGAADERKGLLAEANGGTLFLDEIEELPLETQVALLGVLQDKKFRRLGDDAECFADFRLVSATNGDVDSCVSSGKLRKDFFHRAAHFRIHIPPLRDRKGDVPVLAELVLTELRAREELPVFGFDGDALQKLEAYSWPGNVRELQAVIEGGAYRARYHSRSRISGADIEIHSAAAHTSARGFSAAVREFKLKLINDALRKHDGNQVRAADELELDRSTLRRILARGE